MPPNFRLLFSDCRCHIIELPDKDVVNVHLVLIASVALLVTYKREFAPLVELSGNNHHIGRLIILNRLV